MNEHCSYNKHTSSFRCIMMVFCVLAWFNPVQSQTYLDAYIEYGLENNQGIQQEEFELQRSLSALKEARSLFLPKVSLLGDYFLAGGGRTIDIPVGDIVNPIYTSLNQLTNSNQFPQIENASELLNPNNFYDVKVRTQMPIYNLDIRYNRNIKSSQVALQQLEIDLYKRSLIKEIKTAYFQYLQAEEAVKIYDAALEITRENVRLNRSLFENDKVNRTALIRSENEVIQLESLRTEAQERAKSAAAYFNFLINRPLDTNIDIDNVSELPTEMLLTSSSNISQREETRKLKTALNINAQMTDLYRAGSIPRVNAFLDLGSQGFNWNVNNRSAYYFGGISVQWDLYQGGGRNHRVEQANLQTQILQSQQIQLEDQLSLQLYTARSDLKSSIAIYESRQKQLISQERYLADIQKLYRMGKALFIELIDAQNQYTQSLLQANIARFEAWIKAAEIERANARFDIN